MRNDSEEVTLMISNLNSLAPFDENKGIVDKQIYKV